jgi:hypothetical protein
MTSLIASLRAPGRRMMRGSWLRDARTIRIWRSKKRAIRSGSCPPLPTAARGERDDAPRAAALGELDRERAAH